MNSELRTLPSIDRVLSIEEVKRLVAEVGLPLVKFAARSSVGVYRRHILEGGLAPGLSDVVSHIKSVIKHITNPSLQPVINGTGVVLHTNLGRAPLGESLFEEAKGCLVGYNNLELDLETGQRGERYHHAAHLLRYITGAEDILIVNNNAAAIILILSAFAKGKECVVSRGELVEIGGSFRVPDIMEASGSVMREVGTTNKTKIADYKRAINANTAILCKVHKSNFIQKGFTQELSVAELAQLGATHQILTLYDMGSGLISDFGLNGLKSEPSVKESVESGVDMVSFSADKLFGSCQAGIIAGKREHIEVLRKHPMLRALRVCKVTIALLEASARTYLDENKLFTKNLLFRTLSRDVAEINAVADYVSHELSAKGIRNSVLPSQGQYGGGAMPDQSIESFSVALTFTKARRAAGVAKKLHIALLHAHTPLLANLIKGEVHVNMLCIDNIQKERVVSIISDTYEALHHRNGGAY